MSGNIHKKEKERMRQYTNRLHEAIQNGKIEKFDFVIPTKVIEEQLDTTYRKLKKNGISPERVYHQYVIFCFGRLYEIFDIEDFITVSGTPEAKATRNGEEISIEFKVSTNEVQDKDLKADLIICWVHDKKNLPVEVLELRPLLKILSEAQLSSYRT